MKVFLTFGAVVLATWGIAAEISHNNAVRSAPPKPVIQAVHTPAPKPWVEPEWKGDGYHGTLGSSEPELAPEVIHEPEPAPQIIAQATPVASQDKAPGRFSKQDQAMIGSIAGVAEFCGFRIDDSVFRKSNPRAEYDVGYVAGRTYMQVFGETEAAIRCIQVELMSARGHMEQYGIRVIK